VGCMPAVHFILTSNPLAKVLTGLVACQLWG
jgi:hypothetical protein